jgi:two-component system nitrate/nitrite response regulator NarL
VPAVTAVAEQSTQGRGVVLLDPHPLWLETVAQLLESNGFVVLGQARTVREALALVSEQRPDILLAEITPGDDGAHAQELISNALSATPGLRVVVLSASADPETIDGAFTAGAAAYALKTAHAEDIVAAVRQAFDHSIYTAPALPDPPGRTARKLVAALTRREIEILRLAAEGHSNAQVARAQSVSEQTVKFHLSNVYRKLGVANRTEAGRWAQTNGLISPSLPPGRDDEASRP